MNRHASLGTLSAYLDEELSGDEMARVRAHLDRCDPCRERIAGLRGVVAVLGSVERQAPSSVLGQTVIRRLRSERPPRGLVERLESRLDRLRLESSPLVTFALIVSFAVMLVVLAEGIERSSHRTHLVVAPTEQVVTLEGRRFREQAGRWVQSGLEEATARPVAAESTEGIELRAAVPGIERLLEDGPVVLATAEGEAIELRPASGTVAQPSP